MEVRHEVEYIPDGDHVYRNIRFSSWNKKPNRRRPIEADFVLKNGEDGLSVNWDKYCGLDECFILIGLVKTNKGFLPVSDWKVIKFNVGILRSIVLVDDKRIDDVLHDPKQNNRGHSLVIFQNDEEVRIKLCEIVEREYDTVVFKCPDYKKTEEMLLDLRQDPSRIIDVTM